jgi:hypothetical protein
LLLFGLTTGFDEWAGTFPLVIRACAGFSVEICNGEKLMFICRSEPSSLSLVALAEI